MKTREQIAEIIYNGRVFKEHPAWCHLSPSGKYEYLKAADMILAEPSPSAKNEVVRAAQELCGAMDEGEAVEGPHGHLMTDLGQAVQDLEETGTMTNEEIFDLFKRHSVHYAGNYEITPGGALVLARKLMEGK